MSFEERLLAHFNRPRPTKISDLATIPQEEWNLDEPTSERAQEIIRMFTSWDDTTGVCPISIVDKHWFTKLCGMAEWIALLEAKLDPEAFAEEPDEEDEE